MIHSPAAKGQINWPWGDHLFELKIKLVLIALPTTFITVCVVFTFGKEGDIHTGNFVLKTFSKEPKRLTSKGKKKKTDVERRTRVGQ